MKRRMIASKPGGAAPMLAVAAGMLTVLSGSAAQGQSLGLGYEPSPIEAFASHAHVRIATQRGLDRPKQFTLLDTLPPVGDQGETGSCVGWSTAYYCYSSSVARQRKLTADQRKETKFLFSPAFIWHQYNKGDKEQGMCIYQAFDILAKQGCATLSDMPWDEGNVTSQPSEAAKTRALKFKARQTVSLFKGASAGDPADPEKLRNWLWEVKQPFVIGIMVYQKEFSFVSSDPNFVYTPSDTSGKHGGHAICIVGYDETKHAFLMVNSWGPKWANHGFLWISDEYITKYAHEGWGQRPGGPIARTTEEVKLTPSIILEPIKQ